MGAGNFDGSYCKIMILGDNGVGKTTLRLKFVTSGFVQGIDPTDDLRKRYVTVDNQETLVEFSDIDVIRSHPAFREILIRESEAAMLLYDITSRKSFEFIKSIRDEVLSTKTSKKGLKVKPFAFCVVGNKSDCSASRQVDVLEGEKLAVSFGCHFFETSADTMENVGECLNDVVRVVRMNQSCVAPPVVSSRRVGLLKRVGSLVRGRK